MPTSLVCAPRFQMPSGMRWQAIAPMKPAVPSQNASPALPTLSTASRVVNPISAPSCAAGGDEAEQALGLLAGEHLEQEAPEPRPASGSAR